MEISFQQLVSLFYYTDGTYQKAVSEIKIYDTRRNHRCEEKQGIIVVENRQRAEITLLQ